ncbi:hypothetical protein CFAM422_002802 [Trichoderma lentiforme]|uniref:Uncharacterized protein n=1 Tax=Trichoderma lentiforme TaxID=1567552 RepID=A0A9P4XM97_9HYPO|nr:hypothetical protein CFAM422_002802 [Trichoderma lentiforme]
MTVCAHNDPPWRMMNPSEDHKRQLRGRNKSLKRSTVGRGEGRNGEWRDRKQERGRGRNEVLEPCTVALLLVSMRPVVGFDA